MRRQRRGARGDLVWPFAGLATDLSNSRAEHLHPMNIGHIAGGTNAGWKRQQEKPRDWTCPSCGIRLRYFWPTCPNDNTRRPDPEG